MDKIILFMEMEMRKDGDLGEEINLLPKALRPSTDRGPFDAQ